MRGVLILLALGMAWPAAALDMWVGLTSFRPAVLSNPGLVGPRRALLGIPAYRDGAPQGEMLCETAILQAEATYDLPEGLLMSIGLTEAGRSGKIWPWTINLAGQSHYLESRDQAIAMVERQLAMGEERFDAGCMQINRYWHKAAFPNPAAAFDPVRNVDYAARYLVRLFDEFGSWRSATGAYHSRNPVRKARYISKVIASTEAAQSLAEEARNGRGMPLTDDVVETPELANLLPPISADLAAVDVTAIAQSVRQQQTAPATDESPLELAQVRSEPQIQPLYSLEGRGALIPAKLAPLY